MSPLPKIMPLCYYIGEVGKSMCAIPYMILSISCCSYARSWYKSNIILMSFSNCLVVKPWYAIALTLSMEPPFPIPICIFLFILGHLSFTNKFRNCYRETKFSLAHPSLHFFLLLSFRRTCLNGGWSLTTDLSLT